MAIRDGGDDVDSGNTYYNHLTDGVNAGFCTMDDVDAAVRNTLTVRFELGLFDGNDGPLSHLGSADVGTNASAELNLRATAESLVLLKNRAQTLPLKPGRSIAVVGPHANASRFIFQVDNSGICGGDGTFDCVESPYQAIKRLNVGGQTSLAVGCDIIDPDISTPALKEAAVTVATAADTVVLAIGIAQCGCMGTADTYMGGKDKNPHGCATSVVPP
jgi:beta-glucosidase-like glycosyl hydrolase